MLQRRKTIMAVRVGELPRSNISRVPMSIYAPVQYTFVLGTQRSAVEDESKRGQGRRDAWLRTERSVIEAKTKRIEEGSEYSQ